MFVKIENYLGKDDILVLNTDNFISIELNEEDKERPYKAVACSGRFYPLTEQQYIELCKILSTRL